MIVLRTRPAPSAIRISNRGVRLTIARIVRQTQGAIVPRVHQQRQAFVQPLHGYPRQHTKVITPCMLASQMYCESPCVPLYSGVKPPQSSHSFTTRSWPQSGFSSLETHKHIATTRMSRSPKGCVRTYIGNTFIYAQTTPGFRRCSRHTLGAGASGKFGPERETRGSIWLVDFCGLLWSWRSPGCRRTPGPCGVRGFLWIFVVLA